MRKPRKPTEPFGYAVFGKNGTVSKTIFQLSSEKKNQEKEAMDNFIKGITRIKPNLKIINMKQLQEADQDFLLETSIGSITIQLTELVLLDYAKPLSEEEYRKGHHDAYILKESGSIPWAVDSRRRDSALIRIIEKKLSKHYSKPSSGNFWLVIFSTSPCLETEYHQGGKLMQGMPLIAAREYLNSLPSCIFDQIWFNNLITNPVQIWPYLLG